MRDATATSAVQTVVVSQRVVVTPQPVVQTVVVAEDGMSTDNAFARFLTRYQLLNQPGFANASNATSQEGKDYVTLSRTGLITFN